MATELGVSQLSTTADVTVNLLDINDNIEVSAPCPHAVPLRKRQPLTTVFLLRIWKIH